MKLIIMLFVVFGISFLLRPNGISPPEKRYFLHFAGKKKKTTNERGCWRRHRIECSPIQFESSKLNQRILCIAYQFYLPYNRNAVSSALQYRFTRLQRNTSCCVRWAKIRSVINPSDNKNNGISVHADNGVV